MCRVGRTRQRRKRAVKTVTLSRGARGEQVVRLQSALERLGFDPGPVDGFFGWLTYAALRDVQKHLGLYPDGVAGPRVWSALTDPRLIHLRERLVIAEIDPSVSNKTAARVVQRHIGSLSGVAWPVAASPGPLNEAPDVDIAHIPANPVEAADEFGLQAWITVHSRAAGSDEYSTQLPSVLRRSSARKALHRRLADSLGTMRKDALYLDVGPIGWGDGGPLSAVVKQIGRMTQGRRCELFVSVPLQTDSPFWNHFFEVLDKAAFIARGVRLVLVPPLTVSKTRHHPPSPAQLSEAIGRVARKVPPWHCLLHIRLSALVLFDDARLPSRSLPYNHALAHAYRKGTRPRWDDEVGRPMFATMVDDEPAAVWLENRQSILRKLDLVDRWRLGGVYMSSLGVEDARVWSVLRGRWHIHDRPPHL